MNEDYDFGNFEAVWARVSESSEEVADVPAEKEPAEKLCIIKRRDKSRAVRFIPEI